jgi:hypothetical protein
MGVHEDEQRHPMSRSIRPRAGCDFGTGDDRVAGHERLEQRMMRRLIVLAVGISVALCLTLPAQALTGPRERYDTIGLDAFWHDTRRIDRSTYLRTTWYAGAYVSEGHQEYLFWSDLYKDVQRCEERDGRDRCRTAAYWVGIIDELARGDSFSVDRKLTTGRLIATYRLRQRDGGGWVGGRRIVTVNATLTGLGETHRSEYSEESWEGHCLVWGYEDRSVRREAVATGTLSGDVTRSLGRTRDAGLSSGRSAFVEGDC